MLSVGAAFAAISLGGSDSSPDSAVAATPQSTSTPAGATTTAALPPAAPIDPTATATATAAAPPDEAVAGEALNVDPTAVPAGVPAAPVDEALPEAAAPTSTPVPPPPAPTATPVPPPPPPPAPTAAPAPPAATGLNGMEADMFQRHNQQRGLQGIAGLQVDASLVAIARQRAQDMAANNYFSHTSPTGQTAFSIMDGAGYAYAIAGENIARNNYPDSESVGVAMDGFMNSAGHRENILEPRFTKVGIGVAIDASGMKYFAVVFAG